MTPPPLRLRFTGVVLAALAVGSVVAITINGVAPLLVTRYFTAVAVAGSGLFAVLAQDVLFAYPILATLFAASAAVSFGINAVSVGRERGWDQGAQRLLTLTLACPTTRIHVGSHPRLDHEDVGYAYYAVKLGLVLDPSAVRPDGEGGGGCPTVFWIGQFGTKSAPIGLIGADLVEATNHAAGLGLTPDEMARAHVELVDRGAILVVAPEP